ncbi:hypothetical protein SLS58_003716 [Diplodia intermedia]|uniref:Uncharacterized protein n=1 Tax=Diplodia intermedia TaxID=856260 RepID=A0ABR3TVU2_9PEZI
MSTTLLWPDLTERIHRAEYAAMSPLNPANSHAAPALASCSPDVRKCLAEAAAELPRESEGKSAGRDKVLSPTP